jgi:lysophospholipase L1-like esterase
MTMTKNEENTAKNTLIYTVSSILVLLGLGIVVNKITNKKHRNLSKERIAIIGDSLAVGLGPKLSTLAKETNTPFYSGGAGGSSIRQWSVGTITKSWNLKDNLNNMIAFKPSIVLISLGTNDANGIDSFGESVEKTIDKDIQNLLNKINVTGASIIWITPPNIRKFSSMPRVREHIHNSKVQTIESNDIDIKLSSDGIHPTGEGYLTWANAIWKILAN